MRTLRPNAPGTRFPVHFLIPFHLLQPDDRAISPVRHGDAPAQGYRKYSVSELVWKFCRVVTVSELA
jgi:hypothetical protein